MKLDSEQDRQLLLGMISESTILGAAVKVVAALVQRIEGAEIESTSTPAEKSTSPEKK